MFFAYKKMLGRIESRTRDRIYCQTIRTVRDISRDDRARIATCSLRTSTDILKENYSIDMQQFVWSETLLYQLSRLFWRVGCNFSRLGQNTVASEFATIGLTHDGQNHVKSGVWQGSYTSWKTWNILEFDNKNSRP